MQMFPSEDITEFNGSFRPDADFLQSRVVRQIERETGAADNVRPFHKASQSGLVRRYEKSSKYLPKTAHSLPHNPNIPCVSGWRSTPNHQRQKPGIPAHCDYERSQKTCWLYICSALNPQSAVFMPNERSECLAVSFGGNVSQSEQEETEPVPRHAAVLPDPPLLNQTLLCSTSNPVCFEKSDGEVKKEMEESF